MMKKIFFLFGIYLWGALFQSCYDENNKYGSNLVDSAFRNICTDTSTVTVTSVLIDSLETSGKEVLLVGQYTHPAWGTVKTSGYIPFQYPSYSTDIEETVALDSLVLSFKYNGYYIGDTLQALRFSIHKLAEKVVLNENDYLYNNSTFAFDPQPLATCSFKPRPLEDERVEIRLPDDLGQDLLTRFHNRDDEVSSDRFEDYFYGLAVLPDEQESQSIVAFQVADTSSYLVLHYHIINEEENEQTLTISPNTTNQFNHIDHDRSGTAMESYPQKYIEIPSASLDNRGVIFGGLGWYARLEFPFLNNIMMLGERVAIESASLIIYPEVGIHSNYNQLPDSIYLYIADENNVVTDAVTDYLGTQVQSGTLVKDDTYDENTYYTFDVTDFMQQELGTFGMYKHNLQLVLDEDSYTKTFKNMTFSDQQGRSPIVLQLIYKIYESY